MHILEEGFVVWTRNDKWFSLAQFGDNVLVATNLWLGKKQPSYQ